MTKSLRAGKVDASPQSISQVASKSIARSVASAIIVAGTLIAAMATVSVTTTPAHAAPICYSNGVIRGSWHSGVIKKRVAKRARRSWGDAAQKATGTSRARNWSWATNRNVLCDKSGGFWNCNASARPCF